MDVRGTETLFSQSRALATSGSGETSLGGIVSNEAMREST